MIQTVICYLYNCSYVVQIEFEKNIHFIIDL